MQVGYSRVKLKCTKPFDPLLPKYHRSHLAKRLHLIMEKMSPVKRM